ncbi:Txe/YoeB family addiction module toxin [Colwellia sp. C1TZA3]|uniref:Txe/YoeB family addiction module toxin n=1 Tax=Colwellia sp. C1TZA3 TaxID=2508879 RepID=UPI0011B9F7C9|nr:Txe/YoeB family addiction module toxin [Colwellia sp. C1TZA3]TWX68290.1 Txe/YoeB family addiction module toxin [Colwellia sp. C1TZA3]
MRSLIFEGKTWLTYKQLREKDKKLHKALCKILKEMLRNDPSSGLGKPEPLKHNLAGLWSKRISQKDRLIYKFDNEYIYIFAIGGHYDDH